MLGINRGRRKDKREAMGSPGGLAGKESAHNAGSPGFDPWVGNITWRRERLSTPVFWPGEFHRPNSSWGGLKESDTTEQRSLLSNGMVKGENTIGNMENNI